MASPLYPGYYPGKPLYRDKRPFIKPDEVKMNALEEFLTRLAQNESIPAWIVEQEIKTIRESLVIDPDNADFDPSDVVAFGAEDLQESKGANFRLSLDPGEWLEDPKKMAWETFVTKPLESITDWDEYRTDAKGTAWQLIVDGRDNSSVGGGDNPYLLYHDDETLIHDPRERFYGRSEKTPDGKRKKTPIGMRNPAQALVQYMQTSANIKVRNGNFHKFNLAAVEAFAKEFAYNADKLPADVSPADRANLLGFKESLKRQTRLLTSFDELSQVIGGIVKTGDKELAFRVSDLGSQGKEKLVPKTETTDKVELKDLSETATDITNRTALARGLHLARRELKAFEASASPQEKAAAAKLSSWLDGVERELVEGVDKKSGVVLIPDTNKIYKVLKLEGSKLQAPTYINKGILGELGDEFLSNLEKNPDFVGLLNTKITLPDGSVVHLTSDQSRNLFRLRKIVRNDWEWEALGDMITDLSKGQVPYQIVWKQFVLPRIERYTPSFWIKNSIKKLAGKKILGKFSLEDLVKKYQDAWDTLQKKVVGKVFLGLNNPKEQVKARIVAWLSTLVAGAVAVATDGLSLVAEKIIKIAARFTINKIDESIGKIWKAVKGGHGFDVFADTFEGAIKSIGLVAASCFSAIMVFVLFVGMLISTFSSEDATKVAVSLNDRVILPQGLIAFGGYTPENCPTNDILSLTFANNSSNGPARAGYEIVNKLLRGFWCYWNRNPDFDDASDPDDLFDDARFAADPFPADLTNCADCLFWCTWLPYIAYANAGQVFDPSIRLLGARNMYNYFNSTQTFVNAQIPGAISNIRPGDIAFINTTSGTGWHVAMVYYVDGDEVMTIHSNAGFKEWSYTVSESGTIQSPDNLRVIGFGRPRQ